MPLVITEHTGPFAKLTRDRTIRRWTVRSLRAADRVIAVSEAQSRDLLPYLADRRDRLTVLPNGVDTSLFRPRAPGTGHEQSYCRVPGRDRRVDPLRPRILFAGYYCAVKNIPLLLTALAELRKRIPAAPAANGGARGVSPR